MQLQLTNTQHDRFKAMQKKAAWRYPAKYPDKFNRAREMIRDGAAMTRIRTRFMLVMRC